jgi:hypothetical protein
MRLVTVGSIDEMMITRARKKLRTEAVAVGAGKFSSAKEYDVSLRQKDIKDLLDALDDQVPLYGDVGMDGKRDEERLADGNGDDCAAGNGDVATEVTMSPNEAFIDLDSSAPAQVRVASRKPRNSLNGCVEGKSMEQYAADWDVSILRRGEKMLPSLENHPVLAMPPWETTVPEWLRPAADLSMIHMALRANSPSEAIAVLAMAKQEQNFVAGQGVSNRASRKARFDLSAQNCFGSDDNLDISEHSSDSIASSPSSASPADYMPSSGDDDEEDHDYASAGEASDSNDGLSNEVKAAPVAKSKSGLMPARSFLSRPELQRVTALSILSPTIHLRGSGLMQPPAGYGSLGVQSQKRAQRSPSRSPLHLGTLDCGAVGKQFMPAFAAAPSTAAPAGSSMALHAMDDTNSFDLGDADRRHQRQSTFSSVEKQRVMAVSQPVSNTPLHAVVPSQTVAQSEQAFIPRRQQSTSLPPVHTFTPSRAIVLRSPPPRISPVRANVRRARASDPRASHPGPKLSTSRQRSSSLPTDVIADFIVISSSSESESLNSSLPKRQRRS